MIALKTFKYLIWDYCLTKLFEGINNNFRISNNANKVLLNPDGTINPKNLKVGMHIPEIRAWIKCRYEDGGGYRKNHFIWLNCKIEEILMYDPQDINSSIHITWTYTTHLDNNEIIPHTDPDDDCGWDYDPLKNGGSYDKYIGFYP